jgi:hypothetical protein
MRKLARHGKAGPCGFPFIVGAAYRCADLPIDIPRSAGELRCGRRRGLTGSVSYDAEYRGEITKTEVDAFNRNLEFLAAYDPESEGGNGLRVSENRSRNGQIGAIINPDEVDEVIGLGIYSRDRTSPKWRRISYGGTGIRCRTKQETHAGEEAGS